MPGQWHPLVDAVEVEPTVFELRDQFGNTHSVVRLVTVADGRRAWRAVPCRSDVREGELP